jgi:hypothetical protein
LLVSPRAFLLAVLGVAAFEAWLGFFTGVVSVLPFLAAALLALLGIVFWTFFGAMVSPQAAQASKLKALKARLSKGETEWPGCRVTVPKPKMAVGKRSWYMHNLHCTAQIFKPSCWLTAFEIVVFPD